MKGQPIICRQSNGLPEILAVGLDNGFICFFNTLTSETFLCDACDSEVRLKAKQETYLNSLTALEGLAH